MGWFEDGMDWVVPTRMLDDEGGNTPLQDWFGIGGDGGGGGGPGMPQPPKNGFQSVQSSDAFQKMKQSAFNKSMNPWAMLAIARQKKAMEDNIEKGSKRVAGQTAQAEGNLAMRGGLSSGARERIAEEGQKNFLDMTQDLNRQGSLNELQIGIADAENKMKQQGQVTGLEAEDVKARNAYMENLYNQQMEAWAAERQAEATENSGKGGGK